jgi:hypothetical protein
MKLSLFQIILSVLASAGTTCDHLPLGRCKEAHGYLHFKLNCPHCPISGHALRTPRRLFLILDMHLLRKVTMVFRTVDLADTDENYESDTERADPFERSFVIKWLYVQTNGFQPVIQNPILKRDQTFLTQGPKRSHYFPP